MKKIQLGILTSTFTLVFFQTAYAGNLDEAIHDLQKQWAIANYETAEKDLDKTFENLTLNAQQLVSSFPDKAEPLIWNAIIVSSDAGKTGGLSALDKVKEAKKLLLKAEKINPDALNGSIYTSLGSLYYQVPSWPIAFGDDDKAEEYLKKALTMNPTGIDANYFYADFLLEDAKYKQANEYFQKALKAPERTARPLADKGRKMEIEARLKQIKAYL